MPHRHDIGRLNRRTFVAGASAALAASGAKAHGAAARRANDRLSVALIGVGGRMTSHIRELLKLAESHNVAITAVCDVWKVNLEKAAATIEKSSGQAPRKFSRFGEVLELGDVDAVVIATPDFAHAPILVSALEAGKDVYVEKPMSIDLALANQALDLARANDRVVQAGTQHRSEGAYRAARDAVASGVLGAISRVTAEVDFNEPRWARGYSDCREADVDWDAYLFNRPKQPFNARLLRQWHLFKLCTNGLSGLWMSHYADAVHMLLAAKYPSTAVAHGGIYVWKDGREHTDTFHALLDYPEGFLMSWGMGLGNSAGSRFSVHGTQGTLDVESSTLLPTGGARGTKVKEQKLAPPADISHMANWLECIRSRQRPNADIEYGHQHAVATMLAAAALETGQRHRYDAAKREIVPG